MRYRRRTCRFYIYSLTEVAASTMSWAASFGCDMYATWLDFTFDGLGLGALRHHALLIRVNRSVVGVEEKLCLKEQSQLLTACIAQLPTSLRTVIEDYRMSEPTIAELAQSHSITVAAEKSRLLRAKSRIKKSTPIVNAARRTGSRGPPSRADSR